MDLNTAGLNLLAMDTSTTHASVALSKNGVIYSETEIHVSEHARCLLPMIERLLASADTRLDQLDGIVFGRGPGSFTGLRIACSVAKGLAYAHDLPMYAVSGLAAIAYQVYQTNPAIDSSVLAMIDARMNQVYWALYHRDGEVMSEQVTAAFDVHIASSVELVVAGVGLETYLPYFPDNIQANTACHCVTYPDATALIGLVHAGRVPSISVSLAQPVYVRNQVTQGASRG